MRGRHARLAILVVAVVNLCWSASYSAGKAALDQVGVAQLNALRFSVATLLCLPLLVRNRRVLRMGRGDALRLLAVCGLGFCANKALEYGGLSLTTATDTALLITCESLATLVLAVLVLNERLEMRAAVGLAVGALGVYVLVEGGLVAPHVPAGSRALGDLLVIASLVIEAGATIAGASLMRRSSSPFTLTAAAIALCLVVWLPAGGAGAWSALPHLDSSAWTGILYLGIIGTVATYSAWFWAFRHIPAQAVTPLLLIQPLGGTLLAALLRHERPGPDTLLGGAIIIAGALVVATRPAGGAAELEQAAPAGA